jgi:LacI family transcriptional regulator, galactose operon repressor
MADSGHSNESPPLALDDEAPGRKRPSTIIDVANEAGVAIGTVSRYLNSLPVRHANRELVEDAIRKLGYRRNALAAAMKSDLSNTVGFMVPMLSEYHASVLEQLSERLGMTGRALLSFCHNDNRVSIGQALAFFAAHRVDCLVMDGHEEASQMVRELATTGTPVILYDNDIPEVPVDRVLVENRAASARAVGHLIDIGHTRIATLIGNQRDYCGRERLAGYRTALEARGIPIVPEYIVEGGWNESRGYAAMLRLLSLDYPPTAVFCCNYNMAFGALSVLKEHRYRIPEDISLVSFDDVQLFRLHEVGITSVAQPVNKIAETITGLVTSRISEEGALHAPHKIMLGCEIILRGSTARPAVSPPP